MTIKTLLVKMSNKNIGRVMIALIAIVALACDVAGAMRVGGPMNFTDSMNSTNLIDTRANTTLYLGKNGTLLASISLQRGKKVNVSDQLKYRSYSEYVNLPMTNEGKIAIAQAIGMRYQNGSDGKVVLTQAHEPSRQVDVLLQNLQNMGYEGHFWFGNPSQQIQVVFDTGSAWAWVFSETCGIKDSTCPLRKKRFIQSQSKNFKMNDAGGQELTYGKGYILGHPSEDKGCFTSEEASCVSKFNFLTVVRGKDLEALEGSGIVGLAPTPASKEELENAMNNIIPGFIAQLRVNNEYKAKFKEMFSIYLSNDGSSPGDITFGGYDLGRFAKPGTILKWMQMAPNPYYWNVNSRAVSIGGKQVSTGLQTVIFDNGMSLAMAPEKSFIEIMKVITGAGFQCKEGVPVWSCQGDEKVYAKLPAIEFALKTKVDGGDCHVKMPKEAYMQYSPEYKEYAVLLSPWSFYGLGGKPTDEYWVLGAQFLQNYYSVYDFKNGRVGLAEAKTSILK